MKLVFTGRAVRASRTRVFSTFRPLLQNNINVTTTESPPLEAELPILRYPRSNNKAYLKTKDIHPAEPTGTIPSGESFESFLVGKHEPNTVVERNGDSGILVDSLPYKLDSTSNLSPSILKLLNRRLYAQQNHPISITRKLIESVYPQPHYQNYIASHPVVTTQANFDVLGFPKDHPGRSPTDTYYVNSDHVLRTHTSAHQHIAFQNMNKLNTASGYTICADVFRRDSIDRSHFPIFHQMEGAYLWKLPTRDEDGERHSMFASRTARLDKLRQQVKAMGHTPVSAEDPNPSFHVDRNPKQDEHDHQEVRLMAAHLKRSLETLVAKVFAAAKEAGIASGHLNADANDEPLKVRWVEAYFPFTSPSWELEVFWQDEWLELLGCGIVKQRILHRAGVGDRIGWAWGLGVERLAMLLFGIPDIRLFWSEDPRFLDQFQDGKITRYEPFSKYPACYKDVAFWIDAAPAAASPISEPRDGNSGVAASAGGDATKASPTETQPAAFHENDVMEIVRDVAGSLAEDVRLVDEFVHPRSGRKSLCYRINYRSLERTLTNDEVNRMHQELCQRLAKDLGVELR
jgi:phenylalanyl-tRNA synthetase alpha chain